MLDALVDMEARQLFGLDGARSLHTWLAVQPVSGPTAPDVTLARRLAGLLCGSSARSPGTAGPAMDRTRRTRQPTREIDMRGMEACGPGRGSAVARGGGQS